MWAALGDEPLSVDELAKRTGLSPKQVREAVRRLGPGVVREGAGVRGAPCTYRRAPSEPGSNAGGGESGAAGG